ncbi:hypothetical protein E2C01_075449 [Portunus trituberculatus]|uniref:Uncharacterized protein n=1 Tax=Portunus trituberculatus TaxID=210409 RepID=A0A5B7IFU7_PORTR|nr:hypothetical protein [Portunus trituberculatus]
MEKEREEDGTDRSAVQPNKLLEHCGQNIFQKVRSGLSDRSPGLRPVTWALQDKVQRTRKNSHYVLNWRTNKNSVIDSFLKSNPEIILINSHGITDTDPIKIPGYTVLKINSSGEQQNGSAIAIKKKHNHKLIDDFITNILAIHLDQ